LRIFKNRVSMRMLGPKSEKVGGGWRTLLIEKFHNYHTSANIMKLIKSRGIRWAGHVACTGEMRIACIFYRKS